MAIYEVSVTGAGASLLVNEDEDGYDHWYDEKTFQFLEEGDGLIDTLMSVQSKLDLLNHGLNKRFPKTYKEGGDWEFKVTGIWKTELAQFTEEWIKEYIDKAVEVENEE